jgi:hypothetical protein
MNNRAFLSITAQPVSGLASALLLSFTCVAAKMTSLRSSQGAAYLQHRDLSSRKRHGRPGTLPPLAKSDYLMANRELCSRPGRRSVRLIMLPGRLLEQPLAK